MSIPSDQWATVFPGLPISGLLAEGGMAGVYRAVQSSLDRPVAIKVLSVDGVADSAFVDLFQREARTMAQLEHANICRIYDFGFQRPHLYLVMELLEGGSFHDHVRAGHLTPETTVALFLQACAGLSEAHSKGVLHHDLKPSNLMIDGRGIVKLVDFGLAALVAPGVTADGKEDPIYGTPAYVAPERMITGGDVDHRADIYSMGALLHEMLTGRAPDRPLESASSLSGTPLALDEVIATCLADDPSQRYSSADALAEAVRKAVAPRKGPKPRVGNAPSAGGRRRRGAPVIGRGGGTKPVLGATPRSGAPVVQRSSTDAGVDDSRPLRTSSSEASERAQKEAARLKLKTEQDARMKRAIVGAGVGVGAFFIALLAFVFWFRGQQVDSESEHSPPVNESVPAKRSAAVGE